MIFNILSLPVVTVISMIARMIVIIKQARTVTKFHIMIFFKHFLTAGRALFSSCYYCLVSFRVYQPFNVKPHGYDRAFVTFYYARYEYLYFDKYIIALVEHQIQFNFRLIGFNIFISLKNEKYLHYRSLFSSFWSGDMKDLICWLKKRF